MNSMITVKEYEQYAEKHLPRTILDYYRSGANDQVTLQENLQSFHGLRIRPRFLLQDMSNCYTNCSLLGQSLKSPIAVAPTAMQRMAHPDGELATAKACEKMGAVYVLSTLATSSIEQVAEAAPNAVKWFQLYVYKDRQLSQSLIERAEKAGFKGLVLTVDTPTLGTRLADRRNQFQLPAHLRLANFEMETNDSLCELRAENNQSGLNKYCKDQFDRSLQWDCIQWLRNITKLPIIVKGLLTAEDAKLAVQHGTDAIIVSNHGARQLDHVPSSLEALPEIIDAVQGACEVYFDGGIRCGTDIFKALALGAKAVFIGRPILWGLVYDGQNGVENVLKILQDEFKNTLLLSGCSSPKQIDRSYVRTQEMYRQILQRFLEHDVVN